MTELDVKTTGGQDVVIDDSQLESHVDPAKKVNISDDYISKLEVALKLARFVIIGIFILFAVSLLVWIFASLVGSIQIGDDVVVSISAEGAAQAVNMLLPITTGNVGALIGYILRGRVGTPA